MLSLRPLPLLPPQLPLLNNAVDAMVTETTAAVEKVAAALKNKLLV